MGPFAVKGAAPRPEAIARAIAIVAALIALAVGTASAQVRETPDMARQRLMGGTTRKWVLHEIRSVMGTSERCTHGEVHRFAEGAS